MQPQPTAPVQDAVNGRLPTAERDPDTDRDRRHAYHHPSRWATPARRRTDVYVVDLARPSMPADATDEDPLLLSA